MSQQDKKPAPQPVRPYGPTPGFHKLGPAAQQRALQRAKNFYPFD